MSKNRIASAFQPDENLLGKLLVASPRVPVGFPYGRSVILILQDTEEGVFGVVLNRPASPDMLFAWQQAIGEVTFAASKLVAGGPVQGPVLALHREQNLAEVELHGDLYVSVEKTAIEQLSQMDQHDEASPFRIVMGAVSWPVGQVENEIDNGHWFVIDADSDLVFNDPMILWQNSVRAYGAESIRRATGISQFPADPLLN